MPGGDAADEQLSQGDLAPFNRRPVHVFAVELDHVEGALGGTLAGFGREGSMKPRSIPARRWSTCSGSVDTP